MADGNPEDLVSQVRVTGTEESLAKLDAYAAGGEKAFDSLNKSAQSSAKGVQKASSDIERAGAQAAAGFNQIGNSAKATRDVPGKIKDIEIAISNLTSKLPQLTQAVGRFSQRLALVGAAAVAAGVGLAAAASRVAKAVDGQSDSLEKQTAAQVDSNNAALAAETSQIQFDSTLRKLNSDLRLGKITYSEYAAQVRQLTLDHEEQIRVSREVANAQERVKEENDALNKSMKDRAAQNALIDTFGGPLLQSFAAFGRQVEAIRKQIVDTFGPSTAAVIDTISATLSKNTTAISKFFEDASKRIDILLKNNGPQIQTLLENIGAATGKIFIGVLNALPGLIDFFNNVLVPAIQKVSSAFDGVATAINFVFGTKLTGGSLLLIAIIAQMTGSIRLLFALVRTGSAIFKGFIGVIESVGIALLEVFGLKSAQNVAKLGAAVAKGGGPIKTFLALIRTGIPIVTALGTALASALGIGLAPALVIIGLVTAALIFLLTKVDWKAFGAAAQSALASIGQFLLNLLTGARDFALGVITAWQAVNAFFSKLGTDLQAAFANLWDGIVNLAKAAVQGIVDVWNTTTDFFTKLTAGIAQFFVDLWASVVETAQGVATTLQGVWDGIKTAIVNAFNTAVDTVTSILQGLLAKAKTFLQPILDLLSAIASLSSSASVTGAGGPQAFAGGGAVKGPGTATSDSIPAWLSDGEFIVKTKSVAKYGAGLLHAINNGTFKMPKFNIGGLVGPMINPTPRLAYADGGEVVSPNNMRPLNLSLFGQEFAGLLAPEDVGQRLTKFAVSRQNKSAGRKPAWLGRGRN